MSTMLSRTSRKVGRPRTNARNITIGARSTAVARFLLRGPGRRKSVNASEISLRRECVEALGQRLDVLCPKSRIDLERTDKIFWVRWQLLNNIFW